MIMEEENVNKFDFFCSHGAQTCKRMIGKLPKKWDFTSVSVLFIFVFLGAFVVTRFLHVPIFTGASLDEAFLWETSPETDGNSSDACPEYFRWIHEDLRPWKSHGISVDMIEAAKNLGHFRLVVVNGKLYMEKHWPAYQTRDVFTIWGIVQLMRLYPGKLPDLDLVFQCHDPPTIKKSDYRGENLRRAPPLFHYCGDDSTFDIAFPDWSFWGWPEINIKPWESLGKELEEANQKTKWMDRKPYAYWKGNVHVGRRRGDLFQCNTTPKQNWNAEIHSLDWGRESQRGFNDTNMANQCIHRYKIYVEGNAWSVSEKYILACDSMSLLITPQYYDFFTRGLLPMIHYWPIKANDICRSIKYAVDWGNNHTEKAQKIGKAGSEFILENVKMNRVYDYMFHLLSEYSKLLKYKPTVPPGAVEVSSEKMASDAGGIEKKFKMETMVKHSSDTSPCTMPPPYDRRKLQAFLKRKEDLIKRVEILQRSGKV